MDDGCGEQSLHLENEDYWYRSVDCDSFFLRKRFGRLFNRESVDVTGSRALLGVCRVGSGSLTFLKGCEQLTLTNDLFGLYIPPFSIYRSRSEFDSTELRLMVSAKPELRSLSSLITVFPTGVKEFTGTGEQLAILIKEMKSEKAVTISDYEDPAAVQVKKIIDGEYADILRVSRLADAVGVEAWELSRLFKRCYGLTPLKYLNNIRTLEAVYSILKNGKKTKIIDIAFNVGFRDLSRFNKQFRSFVRFVPRNLFSQKD